METLQHDPFTKTQIKNALHAFLYDPVKKAFETRKEILVSKNSVLGGFTHRHFLYKGVVYNIETTPAPAKKNKLLPQLRDEMEDYLADLHRLNVEEMPYVVGFINHVLNTSNDFHDYLRLLPESVHQPIHALMATCPCRLQHLSDEAVAAFKAKNAESITLMKSRLVNNLLI